MPLAITIDAMAAEVRRELGFRERVYPRWVSQGKIQPGKAAEQTERMEAMLEALEELRLLRIVETRSTAGDKEACALAIDDLDLFRRERAVLTRGLSSAKT